MAFDGIEIGALWRSRGKALYTGKLGNARVIVLENTRKKADSHPDARIFVVPDREREEDQRSPRGGEDAQERANYRGGYGA